MAIRAVSGKPGSGKSYWCLSHLMKRYFEYDKVLLDWIPKGQATIISNIDDLRLDHYRLQDQFDEAGGLEKFFTVDYQKGLVSRWGRVIYFIDEAHKYFDSKLKSKEVEFFFQYHRHLGIDMYLVTTGVSLLPIYVQRVIEYRIQAGSRSKSVANTFHYDKVVDGERAGRIILTKKQEVFKLYKSMDMSETEKPKSLLTKYIVGIIVMVIGFALVLVWMISGFTGKLGGIGDNKKVASVKKEDQGRVITADEYKKLQAPVVPLSPSPSLVVVQEIDKGDSHLYEKVSMIEGFNGNKLYYTESGRLLNLLDIDSALKSGRVIGGQVYIKRVKEGGGISESGPTPRPLNLSPIIVPSSNFSLKEKADTVTKKETILGGALKPK